MNPIPNNENFRRGELINRKLNELTEIIEEEINLRKKLKELKEFECQNDDYSVSLKNLQKEIQNFRETRQFSLQSNDFSEWFDKTHNLIKKSLIKEENLEIKRKWAEKKIIDFLEDIQVISFDTFNNIILTVVQEAFENTTWKTDNYEKIGFRTDFLSDIFKKILENTQNEFYTKLNNFLESFNEIGIIITRKHLEDHVF
jgi:hypothetical protein